MSAALLIELLTEELPPKSLKLLGDAFGQAIYAGLRAADLVEPESQLTCFATPRRLAALISGVRVEAKTRQVRDKLLPVAIAFDAQQQPSAPLRKKLAALGLAEIELGQLERAMDGKTESLFVTRALKGAVLEEILSGLLARVISALPIAKLMSYQVHAGTAQEQTVTFARPAKGLLALHGTTALAAHVLGLNAGQTTCGHRFLSAGPITITHAEHYASQLEEHFVVASFAHRRQRIVELLLKAAGSQRLVAPDALIDEVTALVEWPVVYAARFDDEFLCVPQECLMLTMQQNQKYFALTDATGKMSADFLLVSNLATDDPSLIVNGNQRVLRARLADAKFFFDQDAKRTLESRRAALEDIIYFKKLGSLAQRVQRIEILARELAVETGADLAAVTRAAVLAKADLSTDMVGEFPELQGTMGRYYALNDGETADVALAIEEHYRPRFASDLLPSSSTARCVALADKLETLAGLFAVGELPTGERDPYGLRRQALGVLRILIESQLEIDLGVWLQRAVGLFAARIEGPRDITLVAEELEQFVFERLRGLLRERGYEASEIDAVISLHPGRIDQVPAYLLAVREFSQLPEAPSLALANKRIANLLKKQSGATHALQPALYVEGAEIALGQALEVLGPAAEADFQRRDYTGMLRRLAQLRLPVDQFFADVMVMSEDAQLRDNRLALLTRLQSLMNRFADLSKLAPLA